MLYNYLASQLSLTLLSKTQCTGRNPVCRQQIVASVCLEVGGATVTCHPHTCRPSLIKPPVSNQAINQLRLTFLNPPEPCISPIEVFYIDYILYLIFKMYLCVLYFYTKTKTKAKKTTSMLFLFFLLLCPRRDSSESRYACNMTRKALES